ncbi:LacI family DNA-binding transcriptional regulator [Boudabousia marimammalium]|uniref:HTH lacI-type domain-containing protein n=1 Tax=Boudabousia marimammalium TaxID=156892 RepID=A0A1Q5PSF4_9ACTO|nr:LacI family DNA-binding transcriptional regulator [Boudabousia marimammalium]OKL50439.1 hypothetical protein BM477_00215 [Boudabousia marimammalium]
MATIYDVASLAGVSASTASRILNGKVLGSPNAKKVREAAQQLNYFPSRAARRLRLQKSSLIALMVPDISNSFYVRIARAAENLAESNGYNLIMLSTDDEPAKESRYLQAMVSEPVAGILAVPASKESSYSLALERGVPVVCVDRAAADEGVDTVVMDSYSASQACVRYLLGKGHQRIACISGPEGVQTADLRVAGWLDALRLHTNELPDERLVTRTEYSRIGGYEAANQLLSNDDAPHAIYAANNDLAFGVLRSMVEHDMLPPKVDLCSLGAPAEHLLPDVQIPYVGEPATELGTIAMDTLLQRIMGSTEPPVTVNVGFKSHLK